jgi:hypothetical protein
VTISSMGEGRPEPLHLHAQHVSDDVVRVVRGDEMIVQSTPLNFIADTIRELKLRGHDHSTSVIIYGVSHNPAYHGALGHHGA